MNAPEDLMDQAVEELRAITDPVERAKQAAVMIEAARTVMSSARQIRQAAVNELRGQGMGLGAIGKLINQKRGRVQQIAEGRTGGKSKVSAAEGNADA